MERQTFKCSCGRRMSRWSSKCRKCHEEFMNKSRTEAKAVVAKGFCPNHTDVPLLRNGAMAGWWQCALYACKEMRHPKLRDDPRTCTFQCFTE